jgi:ABC-type transport system substrate-binding protein
MLGRRSPVARYYSLLTAFAVAFMAGCSAAPPPSPTAAPAAKSEPAKPAAPAQPAAQPTAAAVPAKPAAAPQPKVQRLVMAVTPPNTESNELRNMSSPEIWVFRSVYEYPIAVDPQTMQFVPGLATEWSLEPDGMSYRFKLRKGVQFHYGQGEMTAKDFVHVYEDIIKPDSTHGQSNYWRTALKSIEVVNDHELIYHLAKPDGQFITAMSESQGGMEIRSKAHYDSIPEKSIQTTVAGTGPYQVKERVQAQYVRLERVPFQHWKSMPDFPEFEFRFQKEASTRLASLLSGEAHIADLPQDLLAQAEKQNYKILKGVFPGVRVYGAFHCCLQADARDPSKGWVHPESPLMDVRVRQALNLAVNKDELNKAFFAGKGAPMHVNHFLPSRPGWDPSWEQRYAAAYGYNPDRARALLAEAGQSNLKTTIFLQAVSGLSGGEDIAEAVAGYWRAVGVDVALQNIDGVELTTRLRATAIPNGMTLRGTGSNQFTGITQFNSNVSTGRGGAEDMEVNTLLREITSTLDEKKQDELWRRAGERLFTQYLGVNLFWLPAEAVAAPGIVSDWLFPGAITGTWTHIHNIKAAQ